MDEARVVREWAENELDIVLPATFEVWFSKILRGKTSVSKHSPSTLEGYTGLVLIELAAQRGHRLNDTDVKRILWRVRKQLQRQVFKRELSTQHLDLVAAPEPDTEEREGRSDRARLLEAIRDRLSVIELAILSMMRGGANAERIQNRLGISRATYYRRLRDIRNKVGQDAKAQDK